ncbi:D-sedoheptulose-7-phosphate isomerase [Nonomuraea lactucae]|uniref:D-sedoheptulose-7-phosphate isomerase n=1 Tax=Nonomuraea lactucae TaxID=2249762 RepID=UPI00196508F9|nr:SIS domain-containing protein [Nonomuraea lactucae]
MTERSQDQYPSMHDYLDRLSRSLKAVSVADLARVASIIEAAYRSRGTLYVCGNGGSAATASHFAVDMAKNTRVSGVPPVRVVSLVDHVPALTAWANDIGYEKVFSGQIEGLAVPGDVIIGISTSGNSPNVLHALAYGRDHGMTTVGLLGPVGGHARDLCDAWVAAPAESIEEQEDLHMTMTHVLTRHMREVVRGSDATSVTLAVTGEPR